MKEVMCKAWEIARNAAKKFGGKAIEYIGGALKMAYATETASIIGEYNPKVSYANFDAERVESMIFDDLAFVKELETYQKMVSQHG